MAECDDERINILSELYGMVRIRMENPKLAGNNWLFDLNTLDLNKIAIKSRNDDVVSEIKQTSRLQLQQYDDRTASTN